MKKCHVSFCVKQNAVILLGYINGLQLYLQGTLLEAMNSVLEVAELALAIGRTFRSRNRAQSGTIQESPLSPTPFGIYSDGFIRYIAMNVPDAWMFNSTNMSESWSALIWEAGSVGPICEQQS
jgi:hypothetical protein